MKREKLNRKNSNHTYRIQKKFTGIVFGLCFITAGVFVGQESIARANQRGECFTNVGSEQQDPLQQSIASKILRFHVLADSDSESDQELKLMVRDAIGELMEPKLKTVSDITTTEQIVEQSIPEIVATAEQTLSEHGCDKTVTAELTSTHFPVKSYGSYTFPEGEYEALEVVIGSGEGHNWWCVLYPNMCFRDSVYEIVDEEAGEALKKVLDSEEYEDVFESGNYEVQWKLLDYFK